MQNRCEYCGAELPPGDAIGAPSCRSCSQSPTTDISPEELGSIGWPRSWLHTAALVFRKGEPDAGFSGGNDLRKPVACLAMTVTLALCLDLVGASVVVGPGAGEGAFGAGRGLLWVAIRWFGVAIAIPLWIGVASAGLSTIRPSQNAGKNVFRAVAYASWGLLVGSAIALVSGPFLPGPLATLSGLATAVLVWTTLAGVVLAWMDRREAVGSILAMVVSGLIATAAATFGAWVTVLVVFTILILLSGGISFVTN